MLDLAGERTAEGRSSHPSFFVLERSDDHSSGDLVTWLEALSEPAGVHFVSGEFSRPRRGPLGAFAEIIGSLASGIDPDNTRWSPFLDTLCRVLPRRTIERIVPPDAEIQPLAPLEPRLESSRLIDLLTRFLLDLGRERPLLVCLRNFELADRESLAMIEAVARNLEVEREPEPEECTAGLTRTPSRLLLVALLERSEDDEEDGKGRGRRRRRAISRLMKRSDVALLRLGPLREDALEQWVSRRRTSSLPERRVLERLHERSGGSRQLIDEYLRRLPSGEVLEKGSIDGAASDGSALLDEVLRLPRNLTEALFERYQQLDSPDRLRLEALSVSSRCPLDEEAAERLFESLDAHPSQDSHLLREGSHPHRAWLDRMEGEGFLEKRGNQDTPLVGWTTTALPRLIRGQLSQRTRRKYHAALLGALAARGRTREASPEILAYHALEAGFREAFVEHALCATELFERAHCPAAAAEIYEEILDATPPTDKEKRLRVDGIPRTEVRERLAELYRVTRQYTRAQQKLAVILSSRESDPDACVLGSLYRSMGELSEEMGERASAEDCLERSVRLLETNTHSLDRKETDHRRRSLIELSKSLLALARFHSAHDPARARPLIEKHIDILVSSGNHAALLAAGYRLRAQLDEQELRPAKALEANLEALQLAEQSGDHEAIATATLATGIAWLGRGQYDQALELLFRGARLAGASECSRDLARFHHWVGITLHHMGDQDRALEHHASSLRLSRRLGDLEGIAGSYRCLGNVHRLRDDTERATTCFEKAIDLYSRRNHVAGTAKSMTDLTSILERLGRYSEALDYATRALEKQRKLGSRAGSALSCYRIGRIYETCGELGKGLAYAERGAHLRERLHDDTGLAFSRAQLAGLLLATGKVTEAFHLSRKALATFEKQGHRIGEAVARTTLGRVLSRVGLRSKASEAFQQVIRTAKARGHKSTVGACLLELARLAMDRSDYQRAGTLLHEARAIFQRSGHRRQLVESALETCRLEIEVGRLDSAADRLDKAYSDLEELGIRDLVPMYFLLRGRLESERDNCRDARDFLLRGLVEVKELEGHEVPLPEIQWRFHYRLGLLDSRRGDEEAAEEHFAKAADPLRRISADLPRNFREVFYETKERSALRKRLIRPDSPARATADRAPVFIGSPSTTSTAPPPERGLLERKLLEMYEAVATFGREQRLPDLFDLIAGIALDLVNAERAFLVVKGKKRRERRIEAAIDLDRETIPEPGEKLSESIVERALRSGKPVMSGNASADHALSDSDDVRNLRLRSILCVPLKCRRRLLGAIYVDNRHLPDAFHREDLQTLRLFGGHAAAAITSCRLIDGYKGSVRKLREERQTTETFNIKLRHKNHKRNAQLAIAHAHIQDRQRLLESRYGFDSIVGESKPMKEIFFLLERLAGTDLPVLIEGESGTGKELIARAVHYNSLRKERGFVSENCAAMSENLLEAELFGHEKGAFTGAVKGKKGLIEQASGGTLFFDDIGNMSLVMQQKLLRVLEEREVRPIGSRESVPVDVRVISASSQDIQRLVAEGRFREDLYYRLNGVSIKVPSLRERKEDISSLVDHFLSEIARRGNPHPKRFSPGAIKALFTHDWPGNVRELRNLVERTVLMANDDTIEAKDLQFDASPFSGEADASELPPFREARDGFERRYIAAAVRRCGGNVSRASEATGLSRESLYRLLRKHRISPRP